MVSHYIYIYIYTHIYSSIFAYNKSLVIHKKINKSFATKIKKLDGHMAPNWNLIEILF